MACRCNLHGLVTYYKEIHRTARIRVQHPPDSSGAGAFLVLEKIDASRRFAALTLFSPQSLKRIMIY